MTLTELKAKATDLGLTPDDVRQYGSLSKKATWEVAIDAISRQFEAVNTATDDFVQKSEPIPPLIPTGDSGQLFDCLESDTPIRDQLLLKMMDKGLSLSDLEQLQNEPLDEDTATVFLTLLEESDRMLSEALAA